VAHIPDGFLSPSVLAGTAALSVAALAVAARRSRATLGEREAPLLGAATAFVFAAQMLNFPIGAGTSAHLLGGTLVAVTLGPGSGMLVMFAVVLVQALLFQDGGVAALGANALNIAVLGPGVGWLIFRTGVHLLGPGHRRQLGVAGAAAFLSTATVGAAVALELALSDLVPLGPALVVVGGVHLIVGLAEAGLTMAIFALLGRSRPELLARATALSPAARRWAWAAATGSLAIAVAAAYLASTRPDALQAAAERLGIAGRTAAYLQGPFAGYTAPLGGPWVAAALGVVVVFGLIWGVASLAGARRRL
jgi:cobalt/nickel transport system permease protein